MTKAELRIQLDAAIDAWDRPAKDTPQGRRMLARLAYDIYVLRQDPDKVLEHLRMQLGQRGAQENCHHRLTIASGYCIDCGMPASELWRSGEYEYRPLNGYEFEYVSPMIA
jgi:hypothetical protein